MTDVIVGPARRVLSAVEAADAAHLGSLSWSNGLLPDGDPATSLPASHSAWDQAAAQLPDLWRDLSARRVLRDLPLLPAGPDALADEDLWRASVVLGNLAYAYCRCDLDDLHRPSPVAVPAVIRLPWQQVAMRMGRSCAHLSMDDLVLHNWERCDPAGPVSVENMRLLVPQIGTRDEAVFILTFVEMTAVMTPMIQAMVTGQEAVLGRDADALHASLNTVLDTLHVLTERAFPKIDPMRLAPTHVDPLVWAKLVAPTGIPIVTGAPGVSGAAAAGLQALDGFLGRRTFASALGSEAQKVADNYAPQVRELVVAMAESPARSLVLDSSDQSLRGLFQNVVEAYAGDRGYLGVHRRKIFGYLQTATKVGRPSTASGISGAYRSRAWHDAHRALEAARLERYLDMSVRPVPATLAARTTVAAGATGPVSDIRLDMSRTGLTARPGDRLAILPVNDPVLVDRTLALLQATGDEFVPLTLPWRAQLATRDDRRLDDRATLREVLARAWLRPLTPDVARRLLAYAPTSRLAQVVENHGEDLWEVPDALQVLAESGVKLQRLWRAQVVDPDTICRILPPLPPRMYSVAALRRDDGRLAEAGLVIGALEVESVGAGTEPTPRRGTASSLLTDRLEIGGEVDVGIVRPLRFTLPTDPTTPVVMIAAGTGVAPFMGFIAERATSAHTWLLLASRAPDQVPDHTRLSTWVQEGRVRLDIAWSRVAPEGQPLGRIDKLLTSDRIARELVELLEDGRTQVYICGQGGFAATVLRGIREALSVHRPDTDADRVIEALVAARRLLFDVFTTFTPTAQLREGDRLIDVSELVSHCSDEAGWWTAINGVVYDLTLFRRLHPGGSRIIDDNAGVDCAAEYEAIRHHRDTEIQAMLETYRIGLIRRLELRGPWGVAFRDGQADAVSLKQLYDQWVQETYAVVELRNSLRNELALRDLVLTLGSRPEEMTPLKLALLVDTIRRFWSMLIAVVLGAEMADLWAVTAGLTSRDVDGTELGRRLDRDLGHDTADAVDHAGVGGAQWPEVDRGLAGLQASDDSAATWQAVEALILAIDGTLADIAAALHAGLLVFEDHESRVLDHGGPGLQAALAQIPEAVRARRREVAAALAPFDQIEEA